MTHGHVTQAVALKLGPVDGSTEVHLPLSERIWSWRNFQGVEPETEPIRRCPRKLLVLCVTQFHQTSAQPFRVLASLRFQGALLVAFVFLRPFGAPSGPFRGFPPDSTDEDSSFGPRLRGSDARALLGRRACLASKLLGTFRALKQRMSSGLGARGEARRTGPRRRISRPLHAPEGGRGRGRG